MGTWHTRLTQARVARGLDKATFARKVGVSGATATQWESGEIKKLSAENLLKICAELSINPTWLYYGRGERDQAASSLDTASPPPDLAPRQQALLGYFDGLTAAQQDAVLRELQEKKQLNDALLSELLERRKAS